MTDSGGRPPAVDRCEKYDLNEPPERSARCAWWVNRINAGWRPNKRLRKMSWDSAAIYFGVYDWEYLNIICPLMRSTP